MLTFKVALHDMNLAFDRAADAREDIIHRLLAAHRTKRPLAVIAAINDLSTAQADFDEFEQEVLRLERIEEVTDEIVNPFPPSITEKLSSIGIDAAAQRELANEILADSEGGPEAMRAMHENARLADEDDPDKWPLTPEFAYPAEAPDAPWLDDFKVERAPRSSLHGDGHVGPVAQHVKQLAELEVPPQILALMAVHDTLEMLTDRVRQHGERRPRKSKTDELIAAMRAEVEAAYRDDHE